MPHIVVNQLTQVNLSFAWCPTFSDSMFNALGLPESPKDNNSLIIFECLIGRLVWQNESHHHQKVHHGTPAHMAHHRKYMAFPVLGGTARVQT